MRQRIVGVVGTARATPEEYEMAREVGALLAREGFIIINGGLGGVMEAVSRGARSENGLVVGILPTDFPGDANSFVDIPIATGLGEARNAIIVNTAEGFIAIGGGFGTLSEIAFALRKGKPVVGLNTWQLDKQKAGPINVIPAQTPQEAVSLLISKIGK